MYEVLNEIKNNKKLYYKFTEPDTLSRYLLYLILSIGIYIFCADLIVFTVSEYIAGKSTTYLEYVSYSTIESPSHTLIIYFAEIIILASFILIIYRRLRINKIKKARFSNLEKYEGFYQNFAYCELLKNQPNKNTYLIVIDRQGKRVDYSEFLNLKPKFSNKPSIVFDLGHHEILNSTDLAVYKKYYVAVVKSENPIQRVIGFKNSNDLYIISNNYFKNLYRMNLKNQINIPNNERIYDL